MALGTMAHVWSDAPTAGLQLDVFTFHIRASFGLSDMSKQPLGYYLVAPPHCPSVAVAPQDKWYAQYLDNLLWPNNVWVREVLIGLQEAQYECTPSDLQEEIMMLLKGCGSSVLVEDSFRELAQNANSSGSLFLGSVSRWHRLIASNLLSEYDRAKAEANGVGKAVKIDHLRSAMFEGKANSEFSLGDEALEKVGLHDLCLEHFWACGGWVLCVSLFRHYVGLALVLSSVSGGPGRSPRSARSPHRQSSHAVCSEVFPDIRTIAPTSAPSLGTRFPLRPGAWCSWPTSRPR